MNRSPEPRSNHDANATWNSNSHDVHRSYNAEDDDDDSAQHQWASTRTSYAVEREADRESEMQRRLEPPAAAISQRRAEAKTPFNVHGRVPIRSSRDVPNKHQCPQFDDEDSSPDEADDTMGRFEAASRDLSPSAHKRSVPRPNYHQEVDDVGDSDLKTVEAKPREVDRRPPHVATFITFEQDTKASSSKKATSTATNQKHHQTQSREEKLAELRARKLSQLHKAREEQLQQQQQKKRKNKSSRLLLQKTRSTLAAQAGDFDFEHFATTSTPGKATPSGFGTTSSHLRAAKKPSNKKLIQNALEYTLLAGFSMEKERNAALQVLALSSCDNFIVLLKSTKDLKFRALYEHHTDRQEVVRLFASAPNAPLVLTEDTIGQFFKYNSGKKEFVAIDSRAF
ncbi:Calmodulin-regulated spectrin-associated protein 3, partial [Globisporangium polare]